MWYSVYVEYSDGDTMCVASFLNEDSAIDYVESEPKSEYRFFYYVKETWPEYYI